jgi:hypothetical protein
VVVVEGATVTSFVTEATTMLVIGLILSLFGIGLFCWLIFTLAVYALPFFVGLTLGMAAFHGGAGVIGALLVGVVAGALTLGIGQIAFAVVRPLPLRATIAAAFAIPAAIAGYHAVLGLSQIGVPSVLWREVFAWVGAFIIGGTAWTRMTVFAEPLPLRSGGASQNEPQSVLTAATREV